jgi:hypothetical protein
MDSEMACDPKAYQGICDKKLAYIRTELRALGLTFPDEHEGRIHSADIGVEAEYRYTPHSEELWLKVHAKPFFIPCAFIFARLETAIQNYQDPANIDMGPDIF